jgi:hypothetical protein
MGIGGKHSPDPPKAPTLFGAAATFRFGLGIWAAQNLACALGAGEQRRKGHRRRAPSIRCRERKRACLFQAGKSGGLKPSVRRRIDKLAKAYVRAGSFELDPPLRYRPGTVLLRRWKGTKHTVTILEEGYNYNGKTYQSLSRIAREWEIAKSLLEELRG